MKFVQANFLTLICASVFTGCYAEIHESPQNPDSTITLGDSSDSTPPQAEPAMNGICKVQSCNRLPVFVIYSLNQDLGKDNVLAIEAFDNQGFNGSPVASASVTGFDASGTGALAESELMLQPGKYFLRAYIANTNNVQVPYEYGGMKLVSNRPVGFFGAASGAHSVVVVEGRQNTSPVTIKMNYLFKSPESEVPSDANLRILFSVSNGKLVEAKRKLRIELRDTTDLGMTPKATYTLPSESLLVSGSIGTTEFVARNLAVGKYSVLAFVDSNGNEFLDDGEPQQVYRVADGVGFINMQAKRTETVRMMLE